MGAAGFPPKILSTNRFSHFLGRHLMLDPTTPSIEQFGARLVADDFPLNRMEIFVRIVCKWGNDNRIAFRVLQQNSINEIRRTMKQAYSSLENNDPHTAIERIRELPGRGISFGSKHLKFLDPSRSVVLDSIIRSQLGYRDTANGYVAFLHDCLSIRDFLNSLGVAATERRKKWRVSDVEMAIFMKVRP